MHRRDFLIGAALVAMPGAASAQAPPEIRTVTAAPGRPVEISVWRPDRLRGVALLSHGMGGRPSRYQPLANLCTMAGFLVLAPMHTDSAQHPDRERHTWASGFVTRLADMRAASALAGRLAPRAPVVVVGHSYGSLIGMILGGALEGTVPGRDRTVRAVLAFSSPGAIPTAVVPRAYDGMTTPLLLVTGERDILPGFVPDWREHLTGYRTSPAGDKYALIVNGAGHNFVDMIASGEDGARETEHILKLFLSAYGFGDDVALLALRNVQTSRMLNLQRR